MERRYYKTIAAIIAQMEMEGTFEVETIRDIATFFADCLAAENPNFNRERFLNQARLSS